MFERGGRACAAGVAAMVFALQPSPVTASGEDLAAAERGTTRPNLLLVTLDTTRADRFAAWGRGDGLAARIDGLGREGAVFTNCVAPTGTTKPSHASIFTGLYPRSHGVLSNTSSLSPALPTVAEMLRAAGYRTGAFVSFDMLVREGGLSQGFEPREAGAKRFRTRPGRATSDEAIGWLGALAAARGDPGRAVGSAARRPFFAWVHYFDAHSPYQTTPWAAARLKDYDGEYGRKVSVSKFGMARWMDTPADARAVRTLYDGEVHSADAYLAKLLDFLRDRRLLDDTVVIVTADHGQALGEHRHPGHGILWESILRVPLVIWDGREPRPVRVEERVGLVDLAPTLLDLAGVEIPSGLHGRSLVPALRGEALSPRAYFGSVRRQSAKMPKDPMAAVVRKAMHDRIGDFEYEAAVYEGPLKLLIGPEKRALFDLGQDPGELSPLSEADHAASYDRLEALLRGFRASTAEAPEAARVPEDVVDQLRALGYTE